MRALFFAMVGSTAYAFSDYIQSYVQTDSEYIDDIQRYEPIEVPEVYSEPELDAQVEAEVETVAQPVRQGALTGA